VDTLENAVDTDDDSIDAVLKSAFEAAENGTLETVEPSPDAIADEMSAAERARDEKGRFAAQQKDATTPQAPELPTEQTPAPEADKPVPMLASWTAQQRADFAKLPKEAQQIVYERGRDMEAHFSRTTQHLSQQINAYNDLNQVLAPYEKAWNLNGVSRVPVIKQLLEAQEFINSDPHGAIRWIAETTGVNLAEVAQGAPQVDPQYLSMQQQLAQMQQYIQQQEQQTQSYVLNNATAEINSFASETNADGSPLRPHLQQIYQEMQPIVADLRSQNPQASHRAILNEAYERACWANPTIRAQRIQSEAQAAESKRIEGDKARALNAKRAGVSLSGAPDGVGDHDFGDSIDSVLRKAFELHPV